MVNRRSSGSGRSPGASSSTPKSTKRVLRDWFDESPGVAEAAWPGGLKKLRTMTKRELYRSAMTCGLLALNFLEASAHTTQGAGVDSCDVSGSPRGGSGAFRSHGVVPGRYHRSG